jgi:uncharacterized protein YijF (DUF1287 family)
MISFITWIHLSLANATPTTGSAIATAAEKIEDHSVQYIPDYVRLAYPMGDVPKNTGVCTDVVIRAYRGVGIDLQQLVHEDIVAHPERYQNIKKPDTNIDHRRVPNLGKFFKHNGTSIKVTLHPEDYLPGDIVWWKLGSPTGLNHIGVVVSEKSKDGTPLVIHNIGGGQVIENILFDHHIAGHYRYVGE